MRRMPLRPVALDLGTPLSRLGGVGEFEMIALSNEKTRNMPVHPYKLLRAVRPGERDITRPIRVGDPPRRPMLPLPPRWPIVHPPVTPTPHRRYPDRKSTRL